MRHFVSHTNPCPDSKVLLLLDNHASHLSLECIEYCREKGVVLLSFPPHCSHRLQPLDRSVFGPLKRYLNKAMGHWMTSHPAKTMSIYDLPSIVATALPSAATPANIMAGFRCTGIFPFNPQIFSDTDFLPAYVTDCLDPATLQEASPPAATPAAPPAAPLAAPPVSLDDPSVSVQISTSSALLTSPSPGEASAEDDFSPEVLRPFPKAGQRKGEQKGRRRRSTAILTDTPVKKVLEEEKARKVQKVRKQLHKDNTKTKKTPRPAKKTHHEDQVECLVCCEDFLSSKSGEVWVQCLFCEMWAHEACTEGGSVHICHNCDNE
ncbi:hypothetical protein ABVT39_000447 [Epinephelus coioides]